MIKSIILCFLLFSLALPASAMEIEAPSIPEYAQEQMPDETESFAQGFRELLQKALMTLRPDLKEACSVSLSIIAAVMLVSFLKSFKNLPVCTNLVCFICIMISSLTWSKEIVTISNIKKRPSCFLDVITRWIGFCF